MAFDVRPRYRTPLNQPFGGTMRTATLWVGWSLPLLAVLGVIISELGLLNVETLKAWQTLVAGVIAIFAACIGAGAVFYQTYAQERRARELSQARFDAELAHLPVTLKDLVVYVEDAGAYLWKAWAWSYGSGTTGSLPHFPSVEVQRLVTMIEAAPDRKVRKSFAYLIRRLQVQYSRVSDVPSFLRSSGSAPYLRESLSIWITDTAEIYALIGWWFRYSREEVHDVLEVTSRAQIFEALQILDFDEHHHREVFEMARKRFPN